MKCGFAILFLCSLSLCAEIIEIGGNFQPAEKTSYPHMWWGNGQKDKAEHSLSAPDSTGARTLHIKAAVGKNGYYALYGTSPLKIFPGDAITLSGEAKIVSGTPRAGFYIYNIPEGMGEAEEALLSSKDFKPFSITYTAVPRNETLRPVIAFQGNGEGYFRNFKLKVKRAGKRGKILRNFRYYPVYRLTRIPPGVETAAELMAALPEASGFTEMHSGKLMPEKYQSIFKLGHDGKKLYLYIRSGEPNPQLLRSDPGNYQDGLTGDDQVEFGATYDRTVKKSYMVFNNNHASFILGSPDKLLVFNRRGADFIESLAIIDFDKVLPDGKTIEFGRDYFFNIGRTQMAGVPRTHSSFARSFSHPSGFAILTFVDAAPPEAKEKKIQETEINAEYYRHLVDLRKKISSITFEKFQREYGKFGTVTQQKFDEIKKIGTEFSHVREYPKLRTASARFEKIDEELRLATRSMSLKIDRPEAIKELFVNGVKFSVASELKFDIREGLTTIAAVTAPQTAVCIRLVGIPEADGKWRTAPETSGTQWHFAEFDDRKWPMAKQSEKLIFSAGLIRQTLMWNRDHRGELRLLPMCREWLFSENSLDGMRVSIYSPFRFPLDGFRLTFDVPENFHLLNFPKESVPKFVSPRNISTEASRSDRKRIVLEYASAPGEATHYTYLPVDFKSSATLKAGAVFFIEYSRSAGNFVELTQKLPCRVISPVNGRMPRRYIVLGSKLYGGYLSEEYQLRTLQQLAQAGFNAITETGGNDEFSIRSLEKAVELGMDAQIGTTLYPIWGCHLIRGALYDYLKKTPEAQAVRFNRKIFFDKPAVWWNRMFCPTYITTVGRDKFIECVKSDLKNFYFSRNPLAGTIWCNWEGFPWRSEHPYCFCDRCKEAFQRSNPAAAGKKLSDDEIKKNFYREWELFRIGQDAEIMKLTRSAVAALGKRFMLYSQTGQEDFWKSSRYLLDELNPGLPGNGPGDSKFQTHMDRDCAMMKENSGHDLFIGQQMVPFYAVTTGKDDYRKEFLASNTGEMEPELFKAVFVRTAATLRGGLMWYGVRGGPICGMHHYIGEATRLIADYEPLFLYGERNEKLVSSFDIAYPDLLVLQRRHVLLPRRFRAPGRLGDERLVLLFNEKETSRQVVIKNLDLKPNAVAEIWGSAEKIVHPDKMTVTIPPRDLIALYIAEP